MSKSKIFKKILWALIFALLTFGFFLLSCVSFQLEEIGPKFFGGDIVEAIKVPILTTIPMYFTTLFNETTVWTNPAWTYSGFYAFVVALAIYVICVLSLIVVAIVNKKGSLLWNILWGLIPTFLGIYVIAIMQGAFFGEASMSDLSVGNVHTSFLNHYFDYMRASHSFTFDTPEGWKQFAKEIGMVASACAMVLCAALTALFAGIYGIEVFVFSHQHKYDYLEKAENKRRAREYKKHGYKNIANQPVDGKKGKKDLEEASNNPYVQQQQAAMGMYGQPGFPYPYPQPQVIVPPTGGNSVQTGNNAPLIVQYVTNGQDGNPTLRQTTVDSNSESIYGTSRVQEEKLTRNDIKAAVIDVLKETNLLNANVEVTPTEEPKPIKKTEEERLSEEYDILTLEDLMGMIKSSVNDAVEEATKVEEPVEKEEETVEDSVEPKVDDVATCACEDNEDVHTPQDEECCCHKEEEKPIAPIIVAMPANIEEKKVEEPIEEEPEKDEMSEEDLRKMISDQLQEALKDIMVEREVVKEVPVIVECKEEETIVPVEVVAPVKEEVKPVDVKAEPAPIKEEVKPVEVKPEPAPVVEEPKKVLIKQPEVRGKEGTIKKVEAVKLNFSERLLEADGDVILAYNNLKNLLLSYGLKDRLSNSGDTFRLHKVTYCKITMGGSHLKLYLALDPKNYKNSAIPVGDASFKDLYKDIPLVFRVKSDLSLRRARDLVNDCMNQHEVEKVEEEGNIDFASQLKK